MRERKGISYYSFLRDRRVLVMGLGLHGGGAGTVKFLASCGAKITVTDLRSKKVLKPTLASLSKLSDIKYILGKHRKKDFRSADLIIKNPGVLQSSSFLAYAEGRHIPITTDIGLFFKFCPAIIIGVTGTRGKSTTSYLIWKFLKSARERVFLGGNIRKSVLEFLPSLKKGDLVVLELSSFQLCDLRKDKVSPHIAVLTNILRDHLNWHQGMRDYIHAKKVIFEFQKPGDRVFANPADRIIKNMLKIAPGKKIFPRLAPEYSAVVEKNLGEHFKNSVALAIAVAQNFGVKPEAIKKTLHNFHGLEGRQKEVATLKGVHFINDTTATIPDATIAAVLRFRRMAGEDKQLILIAGGQDKKLDFSLLAQTITQKVDYLVLLPGTGTEKLKSQITGKLEDATRETTSMPGAVSMAYRLAQKGDYIVLSPGAASFGLFLNEFDRGDKFVKAVNKLKRKR